MLEEVMKEYDIQFDGCELLRPSVQKFASNYQGEEETAYWVLAEFINGLEIKNHIKEFTLGFDYCKFVHQDDFCLSPKYKLVIDNKEIKGYLMCDDKPFDRYIFKYLCDALNMAIEMGCEIKESTVDTLFRSKCVFDEWNYRNKFEMMIGIWYELKGW